MTYKYEASIKEAINIEYHADFSGYMNRIKELEETYDKARKYDVIEFKARAFDDVMKAFDKATSNHRFADDAEFIIDRYRGK